MKTYLEQTRDGLILKTYIVPGASKSEVVAIFGDPARLKIKIKAPPVDGAANKELLHFLSKLFKLSKRSVQLLRGETSRKKDIFIEISGHDCSEIVKIINNLVK